MDKHAQSATQGRQQDDPQQHAQALRARLLELQQSLRAEIDQAGEPQLKALLETSAEVLGGLGKSFGDYAAKNEAALALTPGGCPPGALQTSLAAIACDGRLLKER